MSNPQLLFITNKLLDPAWQRELRIPLEFVSFALMEGQMYWMKGKTDTFIANGISKRSYGNSVVYGGLFFLRDFDFYIRLLDAYFLCSKTTLWKNHSLDLSHRLTTNITPIHFDNLDDFSRLKYREKAPVSAQLYVANYNNIFIKSRTYTKNHSYRLVDGINVEAFKNLYKAVGN